MLADSLKHLTAWLHVHPHWGIFAAFIVAFLESFAVIGSIIPGSVTLTAIGVLVGSGVIPAAPTIVIAIFGAVLGDTLSYWIGHHYHQRIKTVWPLRKYPNLLIRGEQFFHQHGGKSILVARFIGPIRAILPLVAGMLNMPFARFMIADTIGGILWAPAYMLPGILVGAATLELPPEAATRLIIYLLLALVFIWLLAVIIQKSSARLFSFYDKITARIWQALKLKPRLQWLVYCLQDPKNDNGHGQLLFGISALITGLFFLILALNVYFKTTVLAWNQPVFHLFQSLREPGLDNWVVVLTFFGEKTVLLAFSLLFSAWLFYRKHTRAAIHWIINCILASGAVFVIKHLVSSIRPSGMMITRASYSFPSGHSTLAVAIYGFLLFLFIQQIKPPYKRYWVAPIVSLIVMVILSRLYLGAHWLTDVLGGSLLGLTICLVTTISYRRCQSARIPMLTQCLAAMSLLLGCWGAYSLTHYTKQRYAYTPKTVHHTIHYQQWWQQKEAVLPLYRYNRLGRAIAHCNIQWVGRLNTIEKRLTAHGWKRVDNHSLLGILGRAVAKDKSQTLPVFPQLVYNQSPVLVMTKQIKPDWPILILRLWDPLTHFKDSTHPLWLGSLHYRLIWKHSWIETHKKVLAALPKAATVLEADLNGFKQRQVAFASQERLKPPRSQSKQVSVLLIHSSAHQ